MPKTTNFDESCMIQACEAAQREKKPNWTRIAREYSVPRMSLRDHVKKGTKPRTTKQPVNKVLDRAQEEALMRWIGQLKWLEHATTT